MDQIVHTGRPGPAATALPVARLRLAITLFFALDGFVFAGWVVRIPAIKEQVHASAGALGLALLGVSVGSVSTMLLTGRLCRRYGNHLVLSLIHIKRQTPPSNSGSSSWCSGPRTGA